VCFCSDLFCNSTCKAEIIEQRIREVERVRAQQILESASRKKSQVIMIIKNVDYPGS
jgi:hypothetical protein